MRGTHIWTFALGVLVSSCSCQHDGALSYLQSDGGIQEAHDATDLVSDVSASLDAQPATSSDAEPDPFAFCEAGFGEQCVVTQECPAGPCQAGLLCGREFCVGNVGWPCLTHSDCAEEFRCRGGECSLPGQVGEETWCSDDDECVEEAVCNVSQCRYPLGHWCPNSDWCANGLICSEFHCRVEAGGICTVNTDCSWRELCLDHDGDGEWRCTKQIEDNPCEFSPQCVAGLVCDSGICLTAAGVSCEYESCQAGYRCVPVGSDQHRCLSPEAGSGCDDNADCLAGSECVENRCGYPLFAPCVEANECHPGLVCDETSGLCLRQEGAVCSESECAAPFRCRPTLLADELMRCLKPQVGSPCEENEDCPSATTCRSSRCVYGIGEQCDSRLACEPEVAVCQLNPEVDALSRCYLTDTASCEADDQCAWGLNCVPSDSTNPGGAHLCRPRIPGVGCDDASECPPLVSCTNHTCAMGSGETCSDVRPCADGLTCYRDALPCTTARRCLPLCGQNDVVSDGDHLFVAWAHVIDPGEDCDDDAHIYYEIYSCDVPLDPFDPTEAQAYLLQEKRELPGPHLTEGGLYEWRCDEWMNYDDACALSIYQWQPEQDCVVLRLYESDSCHNCPDYAREEFPWGCCCFGCEEVCFLWWCANTWRTHDTIFLERIYQSETEASCGYTYAGHYCGRCDEGSCYPCFADGNLAVELNLRTVTP